MPIRSAKEFSTFKPGGKTRFMAASVVVYAQEVMHVIDMIEDAVSPRALSLWLSSDVSEYVSDKILKTFADSGGGTPGGSWAPLAESTLRIRHALGYYDDLAINERTGELMSWLMNSRSYDVGLGASMTVPGNDGDAVLMKKLRTAQLGNTQGGGEMLPGASTPPRPILQDWTSQDELELHKMLHWHIVNHVGFNSYL